MAVGPAIAALLGLLLSNPNEVQGDDAIGDEGRIWTVETSPGWVMLALWSIFLVAAIVWFEEPDRSHIFKQDKKIVEVVMDGNMHEGKPLLSPSNGDCNYGGSMLVTPNASMTHCGSKGMGNCRWATSRS